MKNGKDKPLGGDVVVCHSLSSESELKDEAERLIKEVKTLSLKLVFNSLLKTNEYLKTNHLNCEINFLDFQGMMCQVSVNDSTNFSQSIAEGECLMSSCWNIPQSSKNLLLMQGALSTEKGVSFKNKGGDKCEYGLRKPKRYEDTRSG